MNGPLIQTNIANLDLRKDVSDRFLGIEYGAREFEISMKAYVRGKNHRIKVVNDKSLMKMFKLNGNGDDHIDLYVDI